MPERALSLLIATLQYRFVGQMNDVFIFLDNALPCIEGVKEAYPGENRPRQKDRRYYVPAVGREKFARRKDREVRAIFERFIDRGLYEAFIVNGVSQFETFLADVLTLVIRRYPQKLKTVFPGVAACKDVPIDIVLEASTPAHAIELATTRHLNALFYGKPRTYLDYAGKLVGFETADRAFDDYVEIKATRDLIIHNDATVNETYLEKSGKSARGKIGDVLPVDRKYFDHCIANLKRLSGIIRRDADKAFPHAKARPAKATKSEPDDDERVPDDLEPPP